MVVVMIHVFLVVLMLLLVRIQLDDNLDENLAGQIHYDSDDGSCQYIDNCGFCGGGDANFDCAGECSGSLSDGTLLEVPGSSLSGSADDGSWSLSDCSVSSITVTDVNPFVQNSFF